MDLRKGKIGYAAFLLPPHYHGKTQDGSAKKDQKDDEGRKTLDATLYLQVSTTNTFLFLGGGYWTH